MSYFLHKRGLNRDHKPQLYDGGKALKLFWGEKARWGLKNLNVQPLTNRNCFNYGGFDG